MHAIISNGSGSGSAPHPPPPRLNFFFDEKQNGAIWGHFRVSYNIKSSTILMTDTQEFLKFFQNLSFVFKISVNMHQSKGR